MTGGRRRRWTAFAALVPVLAVTVVAGIVVLRDGDDGVSRQAGPARVTVAAERRALEAVLTLPGSYDLDDPVEVRVPEVGGGSRQVVTSVPIAVGERVPAGSVLLEVNYRPVLLLQSALPPYRDLRPGTTGPDVANVQTGLRNLGHEIPDGEIATFGPATREAVRATFEATGHEPDYTEGSVEATEATVRVAREEADAAYRAANEVHVNGGDATELIAEYHRAQEAADEVERSSGVMLRIDSVVTTTETALTVGGVSVSEGRPVTADSLAMTLSPGDPVLLATLSPQQAHLFDAGPVEVLSPSSDCEVGEPVKPTDEVDADVPVDAETDESGEPSSEETTIIDGDRVGDGDGGAGSPDSDSLQVAVRCQPPPSIDLTGSDTVVTLSIEVSDADSLIVPATALVYGADGSPSVIVIDGADETRTAVNVVAEANGFVAIGDPNSVIDEGTRVAVDG